MARRDCMDWSFFFRFESLGTRRHGETGFAATVGVETISNARKTE